MPSGQAPNGHPANGQSASTDSARSGEIEPIESTEAPEATEAALPVSGDEDGPSAPSEADEAAFLAEARARGESVRPVTRETIEEVEEKTAVLPKLDELVSRIPAEVRETLDELFRARFVAVRRVSRKALKK